MAGQSFSLRQASIVSDGFAVFSVDPFDNPPPPVSSSSDVRSESYPGSGLVTLHRILFRLGKMDLPGRDHVEAFLRHVTRRNRRPRTPCSLWTSVMLFLGMLRDWGRRERPNLTLYEGTATRRNFMNTCELSGINWRSHSSNLQTGPPGKEWCLQCIQRIR